MEWIRYLVAVLFAVAGLGCALSVALSLPGTWVMLALAAAIELADGLYLPDGRSVSFSWPLILACTAVATLGELLEFLAGVLGAKRAGSSTRGAWGALLGGLAGAVAGLAIPAPILGSLIGALAGTFAGAVVAELSIPEQNLRGTLRPAAGATLGRVLGTLAKLPLALLVWLALSVAAFWPWAA